MQMGEHVKVFVKKFTETFLLIMNSEIRKMKTWAALFIIDEGKPELYELMNV